MSPPPMLCCRRSLPTTSQRRLSRFVFVPSLDVYRPGSDAVQQMFFNELATLLDRVDTYSDPIYVVGDFSIRLDRPDDPHADRLHQLVQCYGLTLHSTGPTHTLECTLDAVSTYDVAGRPSRVAVKDTWLSYHFLLRWECCATRDVPPVLSVCSRPWGFGLGYVSVGAVLVAALPAR